MAKDGILAHVTMNWSPPLCEMLTDPLLQGRYRHYCERLLELCEQEVPAKSGSPFAEAALTYRDHFRYCLQQLDRWQGNILQWVKYLDQQGAIECITCTATHGFLPLMQTRSAQRAQIQLAQRNFRKHFARDPKGIWLAECGYTPGVEELLKEQGIRYFFVDTHGINFGTPRPRYSVYAPVYTPCGVAAFGRDIASSRQVWSAESGYPGDPVYREFYRDLGYDGGYDYIRTYLHPDGVRRNLGLKYHAVTGNVALNHKQPWQPTKAFARAMDHGRHFAQARIDQAQQLNHIMGKEPLIVSPYDAELFGHWWFEGPQFIESALRALQGSQVSAITMSAYLERFPAHQIVTPTASSWGDAGYNGVWLNPKNDWMYRHLHHAEERMQHMARDFHRCDAEWERVLNQMARELLLAQSSDWAFICTTGTSPGYAERRFKDHIHRFTQCYDMCLHRTIDYQALGEAEWRDSIFQEIDFRCCSTWREIFIAAMPNGNESSIKWLGNSSLRQFRRFLACLDHGSGSASQTD